MKAWKKAAVTVSMIISMTAMAICANAEGHTSVDAYHDDVKIAVCLYSDSDNTAIEFIEGFDDVFGKYDNVTYQVFDAAGSTDTQISQLEDTIIQGFDAVMVQATDEEAIITSCQEVMEEGIPLISLNLAPNIGHAVCISCDGQNGGKELALQAIEDAGKDSGKWVFLAPPEGALSMKDMPFYGFKTYMDSLSSDWELLEMQCCDYTTEMGQTVMADMLTKFADIDFAFCANDEMAEGAAMACQAAGREEVNIYGASGSEKMLEYIEKGLCTGTMFVDNVQAGALAAKFALYAITSDVDMNVQSEKRTIYTDYYVVTKENTEDARADLRSWGIME